jgi:hypothetical protein
MKVLTGREASVLSLLAMAGHTMTPAKIKRALGTLEGDALAIGKTIVGKHRNPSKSVSKAASGFLAWAEQLEQ